jgi:hypothetical protein
MEDKDQFDALMQLAEFRMARQRARRELEWKMSLSLWALLVGAIYP